MGVRNVADDVLSQGEIDALLTALSSGEMDAEELKVDETENNKIKVYDFKRALRFSKDQIRGLTRIHENFARLLTSFFSGHLRSYVSIQVASVDQVPYEEFIRSVPSKTILNVFSADPLEGRLLFEVNPNIAYAILDRMLGGSGSSLNKVETLTEIETKIMSRTFGSAMESLEEAWESMVSIDVEMEDFEVNPQFLQIVSPNETVIVISLNTMIGESSGMMNICIPHILLEPIIFKLSVHYWMENQSHKRNEEYYHFLQVNLSKVSVDVKTNLGESSITIEDFLHLQTNDVIKLDQSIHDPLKLYVDEEPKFYVHPGKKNNHLSVQVISDMKEEDDG